ncbi:molybdate transport system ATP-binding protein [Sphingomonas naasensis]|uniref:ATP-binding cassette domain-containing protein n=1 Tax=Sphingomonas naasensis TaxID=1344951 RepID=A0A4S1WK88_9SPHN|nr:ATP-binding cassette domain-containing protein [Sphingomonas naasensis]NIJ20729.1 molybdate transport system ATP-binding protein [Sphingomonas naasensis]TGX43143.1 ATP-binding cassette domain-containing protein [Sphingomonas naasensis]
MSFDVDVGLRRGDAAIACRIEGDGLTVLFGPSGAGKTSVLNMVAGLISPDFGHVRVGGETLFDAATGLDLPPERRRAGYVFQEARLFPHKRVRANLLYGWRHGAGAVDVDETIALLGLAALLDRWPRTLSGGEARRVAIGRALLSNPRFLLLDEPLSSLDRARREEIMALIERLRDALGLPILLVTHDRDEAERLGKRIVEI